MDWGWGVSLGVKGEKVVWGVGDLVGDLGGVGVELG